MGGVGAWTGVDQFGVSVAVGDIAAGETVTVRFAYAFDESFPEALALALWATETDDRDADGVAVGEDCDDLNAAEQTDCDEETEDPDDAKDSDTGAWPPEVPQDEGVTVTTTEVESGCQVVAAGGGLWWVLLGLWRRRR